MITVVQIKNPFDPLSSREIRQFPPGKSVRELFEEFYPQGSGDYTVEIAVNGHRIDDPCKYDLVPLGDTSIAFCAVPGGGEGKNPLAVVAMLAVMVVAVAFVQPELVAIFGMGSPLTALGTTAFVVAGGLAVSAIFPPSVPDSPVAALNESPTYSWTPSGNTFYEGGALPELFGTHRVTPPMISRFITVVGDEQRLNMLFAVAGHEIDNISSIRVNGNPAETYPNIQVDTRRGTADQTVIPGFEWIRTDAAVGVQLEYEDGSLGSSAGWVTRRTTGNILTNFGVVIGCPGGLYHIDGTGAMQFQSVRVAISFRKVGDTEWRYCSFPTIVQKTVTVDRWSGGFWYVMEGTPGLLDWQEVEEGSATPGDHSEGDPYSLAEDLMIAWSVTGTWHWLEGVTSTVAAGATTDDAEIVACTTQPIYRSFYLGTDIAPGQYDIRCKMMYPTSITSGQNTNAKPVWVSYQEIVKEELRYPGVSLLAVTALATEALSGGDLEVDCMASRVMVPVYRADDPGVPYQVSANSPAWACYYLLNRGGEGTDPSRLDYAAFFNWHMKATVARGYQVNLYVDTAMSIRRVLDMVSLNGRGVVTQVGSKFTALMDLPEDTPVQRFLFTMGNIAADSFAESWMPTSDRANSIEVTFFDAEMDYERQTVEVLSADYDTTDKEINKVSVTLYGCTSRNLATMYGRFLLYCNRYLTLTSSWDADVDAIACLPNDPVDVAHDVPQWGESGRLVSYDSGTGEMVLDREVTMQPATSYVVMVRRINDDSNDLFAVATVGVETTTHTLTVTLTSSSGGAGGASGDGVIVDSGVDGALVDSTADGAVVQTSVGVYPGSVYSFGTTAMVVKPMRVMQINRSGDLRRKLVCLEYNESVYVDGVTY